MDKFVRLTIVEKQRQMSRFLWYTAVNNFISMFTWIGIETQLRKSIIFFKSFLTLSQKHLNCEELTK